MGTFTLSIETDGAAFDDAPASELSRILRDLADRIEDGTFPARVYDANGNGVGAVAYEHPADASEAHTVTEADTAFRAWWDEMEHTERVYRSPEYAEEAFVAGFLAGRGRGA